MNLLPSLVLLELYHICFDVGIRDVVYILQKLNYLQQIDYHTISDRYANILEIGVLTLFQTKQEFSSE